MTDQQHERSSGNDNNGPPIQFDAENAIIDGSQVEDVLIEIGTVDDSDGKKLVVAIHSDEGKSTAVADLPDELRPVSEWFL